jgi:hypothetical protein
MQAEKTRPFLCESTCDMQSVAMGRLRQVWKMRLGAVSWDMVACGGRLICRVEDTLSSLLPSGRTIWERRLDKVEGVASVHVIGDSVYVAGDPVLRIDPITGRTLASRSLGPWPHLRVAGEWLTCFAGTQGRFLVVRPDNLETALWLEDEQGTRSVHGGFLCTSDGSEQQIADLWTGDEIARVPKGLHTHFRDWVCFFLADDRLAIDLGSGEIAWRWQERGPTREWRFGPGHTVTVSSPGAHDWAMRVGDVAVCLGRALTAYDLRTGKIAWKALEHDVPCRSEAFDGLLHVAGEAVHVLDMAKGRILGSSPALERQVTGVAALPDGTIVVKCFTYDRNSSELRAFALETNDVAATHQ